MNQDPEQSKKTVVKNYNISKIKPTSDRFDYWYSAKLTAEQTKGWTAGDRWRRAGHEQYMQPCMKPMREHRRIVAEIKRMIGDGNHYLLSKEQRSYLADACPYGPLEHPDEMPYSYVRVTDWEKRDPGHLMFDPLQPARD